MVTKRYLRFPKENRSGVIQKNTSIGNFSLPF